MQQIAGTQDRKNFADGMAGRLQFARANSVIVVLVFPNERISEIARVDWIPVRSDGIGSKHMVNV